MTIARKVFSAGTAHAASMILAGCMTGGGGGGPAAPRRRRPASKATWMTPHGDRGFRRFSGGIFTTIAIDTGNKLADGSYMHDRRRPRCRSPARR